MSRCWRSIKWSRAVQERDGHICQHCHDKNKINIHSHHIVSWHDSVELRFEVSNGITLCGSCHNKEHHKIGRFKIGDWSKGRVISDKHRENLSESHKGQVAWNKGLKGVQSSTRKGTKQPPRSEEVKKKIGDANRGRSWKINPETGKRMWVDK